MKIIIYSWLTKVISQQNNYDLAVPSLAILPVASAMQRDLCFTDNMKWHKD